MHTAYCLHCAAYNGPLLTIPSVAYVMCFISIALMKNNNNNNIRLGKRQNATHSKFQRNVRYATHRRKHFIAVLETARKKRKHFLISSSFDVR